MDVNAYTLTFAVFLLTGAALGDRFGRRRMFALGIGLFTFASAAAALAPSMDALITARALQGIGGALVMPLTLTILSDAFPSHRRGAALGLWSAVAGIAVASGPLVGGIVIEGIAWQWIFWLNVPIGIALIPLALRRLGETHGHDKALDLPGLALVSTGLLGLIWGIVNGNGDGWTSITVVSSLAGGILLLAAFVVWELRTRSRCCPCASSATAFAAANTASLLMNFGMFGAIFLLTQFFQTAQGYSPLESGYACSPGPRSNDRGPARRCAIGSRRRPAATGDRTRAPSSRACRNAAASDAAAGYAALVGPFVVSGIGMGLFFAPLANVVLGSVQRG